MAGRDFNYEIVKHIAKLGEYGDTTKELNLVSYNGQKPKYDIRSWKRGADGKETLLRGVTLTAEEAHLLRDALDELPEL